MALPGPPSDLSEALYSAAKQGDLGSLQSHLDTWRHRLAPDAIAARDLECVLRQAVRYNRVAIAACLLDQGAEIIDVTIACGFFANPSPLEVYGLFLQRGWNINTVPGPSRGTLLENAAMNDQMDLVAWCLAHGSDPNVRNRDGYTAMDWAAISSSPEMIRLLVQHGGDLARSNALHAAAAIEPEEETNGPRRLPMIDCLLDEFGMDTSALCDWRQEAPRGGRRVSGTPLHWAIMVENPVTVAHLLRRGASVHDRNVLGQTVTEYAACFGTEEIKRLVLLPN